MQDYPSLLLHIHLHICSMSFICLPGFQHERFLKSHWRRTELGPQQWARNETGDLDRGRALTSICSLETLPSPQGALLWSHLTASAAGQGDRAHPVTQVCGSVEKWFPFISGFLNLIKPIKFALSGLQSGFVILPNLAPKSYLGPQAPPAPSAWLEDSYPLHPSYLKSTYPYLVFFS